MMTEQTRAEQAAPSILQTLCPEGVRVSQVSLEITETATEESLAALARMLDEVGGSHQYILGDYINYVARVQGESEARKFISKWRNPETARIATWVCRKVTPERRLISPSYAHSYEVAKLDPTEQEHWLTRAKFEQLNRKQLRAELRQRHAGGTSGGGAATNQGPVDQAAASAWAAQQTFAAWYAKHRPSFDAAQVEECDALLLPLVTDYVARMDADAFATLCAARQTFLEA